MSYVISVVGFAACLGLLASSVSGHNHNRWRWHNWDNDWNDWDTNAPTNWNTWSNWNNNWNSGWNNHNNGNNNWNIVTVRPVTARPITARPPNTNPSQQAACAQLLTTCRTKGNLATRLSAGTGGTPTTSVTADLTANYDANRDGCISLAEYEAQSTARGFSMEYARYQFLQNLQSGLGINPATCPGAISIANLGNPTPVAAATINNANVQALVNFCEGAQVRYQTNCDCIQLPSACVTAPLSTTPVCQTYSVQFATRSGCPYDQNSNTDAAIRARCQRGDYGTTNTALVKALCDVLLRRPVVVG